MFRLSTYILYTYNTCIGIYFPPEKHPNGYRCRYVNYFETRLDSRLPLSFVGATNVDTRRYTENEF